VTCDGRLLHRRVAATRNAFSMPAVLCYCYSGPGDRVCLEAVSFLAAAGYVRRWNHSICGMLKALFGLRLELQQLTSYLASQAQFEVFIIFAAAANDPNIRPMLLHDQYT